jgi:uncharacterized membrane protein
MDKLRAFDSLVWSDVLGHLHPLVLHLPIGLIVALAWLEFWGWFKKSSPDKRRGQGALVWLLVLCTPSAALTGWFLHESGGYGPPVEWHERGGIFLASLSLLMGLAFWRRWRLYPWLVWIAFLLLVPTAHLGATLTHGEEFLLEPWLEESSSPLPSSPAPSDPAPGQGEKTSPAPVPLAFADVLPIFEARCTRCHGERKQRGELALHTLAGLLAGGETGPALVPGDPAASPVLQRLMLPLEHDDHMPPANKPQPSAAEIDWIAAFVRGEPAPGEAPRIELEASSPAADELDEPYEPDEPDEPARGPSSGGAVPPQAAESARVAEALSQLSRHLAHVQGLSAEGDGLWIDLSAASLGPGQARAWLEPLAGRIVELSLAGTQVQAQDLALVASMPRLARLDLRRLVRVAGAPLDLAPLLRSNSLRVLNLAETPLDPQALEVLAGMAELERVYLWDTGLDEALALFAAQRPELEVVGQSPAPDAALEAEAEVVFERLKPPPEPSPAAGALPEPRASNASCPVTGSPVDARYTILHAGRAIGFCCPNCPKSFWEDPGRYLAALDQP